MQLRYALVGLLLALPARAQESTASAKLTNWPLSTLEAPVPARHWRGLDILPFIDTMTLTLAASDAGERPAVAARVLWRMGREGIKKGRRVPAQALPADIRLAAFVLRADVMQRGERVAGLTLAVDSTRLAAGQTLVLEPQADWPALFDGVSGEQARRIVNEGFTLDNLHLARAAFGVFATETSALPDRPRERVVHRGAYDTNVWVDVAWNLTWLFGDDPYPNRAVAAGTPRTATRRDASRDEDDRPDKKDEDEAGELLPAALMVGAGVVAAAVLGGTAGYAAQGGEPIGLAAGYYRREGGLLLQASVNGAALGMEKADESISAQVLAFYGGSRWVQPALGLGARYHERAGIMQVDPVVTVGAVLRGARISALVGYEVFGNRPAFGLFYTFRQH